VIDRTCDRPSSRRRWTPVVFSDVCERQRPLRDGLQRVNDEFHGLDDGDLNLVWRRHNGRRRDTQ